MIIFNLFINFLEAFIFSYFIAEYFFLDNKKVFIALTTIVHLIILMLMPNGGIELTLAILLSVCLCIGINNKKITFDHVFIVLTFNTLILCTALIAVLIEQFFISMGIWVLNSSVGYVFRCLFSKVLLYVISYIMIKRKYNFSVSLQFQNWWFTIVFEVILMLNMVMISCCLSFNVFNRYVLYFLLITSVISVALYKYTIFKIDSLNKVEQNLMMIEQLNDFNGQKLKMIKNIKHDVEAADHRLFYIVFQLENYLENNQVDKARTLLKSYKNSILNNKLVMETGNSVFDYLMSLKMNELSMSGMDITNSILISHNSYYNDLKFINFLTEFLELFDTCKQIIVSIHEVNHNILIKVIYRNGTIDEEALSKYLESYTSEHFGEYKMNDHERKGIRVVLDMKDESE